MSDTVSNDVSTESLCTVIENLNAPPATTNGRHLDQVNNTKHSSNNNNSKDIFFSSITNNTPSNNNNSKLQTNPYAAFDEKRPLQQRRRREASSDLSDSSGNGEYDDHEVHDQLDDDQDQDQDRTQDSDSRPDGQQDSSFEDGGISLRECDWTTEDDAATTTEAESNRETTPEKGQRPPIASRRGQEAAQNEPNKAPSGIAAGGGKGLAESEEGSLKKTPPTLKSPAGKTKKTVSFDPNDEKVRKFITGEPIVDQQNPFKVNGFISSSSIAAAAASSNSRRKKTPPPVPTRRSTLSIKKTVTQQLREREREREKEKERERVKNEVNNRRTQSAVNNGNHNNTPPADSTTPTSPGEEFITTEEVLKQSKYVKTYIKNPDPVFVYDPAILARLKFEELRDLRPPKSKLKTSAPPGRARDLRHKDILVKDSRKIPTFKKCSKPNYPELSDIKVRCGTDLNETFFNPAEVTKNARKFDERAKKLHLSSEDDLDEIDGPLTKSESSDEVTLALNGTKSPVESLDETPTISEDTTDFVTQRNIMNGHASAANVDGKTPPEGGTFTNTIRSREFQDYLNKKGLTLIPKKIPSGAQAIYTNGGPRHAAHMSFRSPERVKISFDNNTRDTNNTSMDASGDGTPSKKPSVFQRLLANSIFASRRRTTPKDSVPSPRSVYSSTLLGSQLKNHDKENPHSATLKRVVLERQSFHGRPRAHNNLLPPASAAENPNELLSRSRKSFAGGDDLSISISSALTNAEFALSPSTEAKDLTSPARQHTGDSGSRPMTKPPRRTLSRDRLGNGGVHHHSQMQPNDIDNVKPTAVHKVALTTYSLPRGLEHDAASFQRTTERQSCIPKRATQPNERQSVFGRSASMDRHEMLKRNATRAQQQPGPGVKVRSPNGTMGRGGGEEPILHSQTMNSRDSLRDQFNALKATNLMTSTPIKRGAMGPGGGGGGTTTLQRAPSKELQVDQQEWQRLRAMKERTDRELYHKMLQQQQLDTENIYEHLKPNRLQNGSATMPQVAAGDGSFLRGSPQRNTFSGVTRNRQVKIIDGRAVLAPPVAGPTAAGRQQVDPQQNQVHAEAHLAPRSQSVLDGMTMTPQQGFTRLAGLRRGYESDNETPVIFRRKGAPDQSGNAADQPRRIGGILTREEILAKVKEFCRKSLNKTPTVQAQIHAQPSASLDISPVSYASVETHHRPISRLYTTMPQVPQRMQSLPEQVQPQQQQQHFVPVPQQDGSPIYAHVVKRTSLQSNHSELYDSPHGGQQRPYLLRRESDATRQQVYIRNGATLQPAELIIPHTTPQYVLVDGDTISPAQVVDLFPAQSQYVRPHQLQPIMAGGTYGTYILPQKQQQQLQQQQQILHPQALRSTTAMRLNDCGGGGGRATPLILDRSSQQVSQIYWTPHQQQRRRLQQQHAGLLPVEISPRYTLKQPIVYPVAAPRNVHQPPPNHRAMVQVAQQNGGGVGPAFHKQQLHLQHPLITQQQSSPRGTTPPIKQQPQLLSQLQQQQQIHTIGSMYQPPYEWESGSEAGEVQRIMENRRHSNGGEFKGSNVLKTLKLRFSKLVGGSAGSSSSNILKR